MLEELKWRGFIKDVTNYNLLEELLKTPQTIYIGFDPTASSLHLGHLVPINLLAHLQKAGHRIIAVVGGATALIGDPRGSDERPILTLSECRENQEKIKRQLEIFLNFTNGSEVVNNYDWLGGTSALEFMRDIGKFFTVTYMLNKEVVNSRLESGISYTEFSYMLLQASDFHYLFKNKNCRIQFGGSDQWGNITTGVELVRKKEGEEVVGATLPLITTANGAKFGKSLGNALYLDAKLTSPYQIYQYFINTDDNDVLNYLKVFTFLSKAEIEEIVSKHLASLGQRVGQKVLAYELIKLMHGTAEAEKARKMSEVLFSGDVTALGAADLRICLAGVPSVKYEGDLLNALIALNVVNSKRAARELIDGKAVSVNGTVIDNPDFLLKKENAIDGQLIVIRKGKKHYYIIEI